MTTKAVGVATDVYEQLVVENGGEPPQPWAKVKKAMAADKATKDLVEFLPNNLRRAVMQNRKARLVKGRPRGGLAVSGTVR